MAVAVVIVSHNSAPEIGRALDALPAAAEILVVDNASHDRTCAVVRARAPRAELLALGENVGFARAVNLGVARTTAEHVLLLNPDTRLIGHASLGRLEQILTTSGAGALGPRLVDGAGELQLSVGAWPSLASEALRCAAQRQMDRRKRWGQLIRRSLGRVLERQRRVPWVSGAALMVTRAAFLQVGGFDPRYFLFFEDIDFCLRLWHAGFEVLFEPSVTVEHARGRSASRSPTLAQRAYRDSQARNARQYMHPRAAALVARYAARQKAKLNDGVEA